MQHDILITAKGHKGTFDRLTQEFSAIKLFESPDRAAVLKVAAPCVRWRIPVTRTWTRR